MRTRRLRLLVATGVGVTILSSCSGLAFDGGDETYAIAYQGPLSGDTAQLGVNIGHAVQLAVEQANERGTLPFDLEYVTADDKGLPEDSPAAARRLIRDRRVLAVIGPAFSGPALAAGELYGRAGLAAVSPSATSPAISEAEFATFFRAVPQDAEQGAQAARYLANVVNAQRVYILDDTTDYGSGLAAAIEAGLADLAVPVQRRGVPTATDDYTRVAEDVVRSGADALYYAGYFAEAAPLAGALQEAGYHGIRMGGDGLNDDKFIARAGGAAEGWQFTCACTDARSDPAAARFFDEYAARFQINPGTYSPEAYDATQAVIAVLGNIPGEITRKAVIEGLRAVNYGGIVKTIKFQPDGEIEGATIFLYEVRNGTRQLRGSILELSG
ncbi:MAG: branched-chain amino acid ABC transporter substrate-binding protein [Carbonactinosporaceae bacterium]